MLREMLIGQNPSHFQINPIVKVFIIAESFLWGSMNFILPIFALFVTTIPGGNVEVAATVYSAYMLVRVVSELLSGRLFTKISDDRKIALTIGGMILMSFAYLGFAASESLLALYFFYGLLGFGIGIISPIKNTLFSTHLDKNKEAMEWSLFDGMVFFFMAIAAAIGGYIAKTFGFQTLFSIAALLNLFGIIPYIVYIKHNGYHEKKLPFYLFFLRPFLPRREPIKIPRDPM